MRQYTIYLGGDNRNNGRMDREKVIAVVLQYFPNGATVHFGTGIWGKPLAGETGILSCSEEVAMISVLRDLSCEPDLDSVVYRFIRALKQMFEQEYVLFTYHDVNGGLR